MAKFVVKVAVQEAKKVCGTNKLYRGTDAVIEGVIHAMRLLL